MPAHAPSLPSHPWSIALLVTLATWLPALALADGGDVAPATRWQCGYDGAQHLSCLLDTTDLPPRAAMATSHDAIHGGRAAPMLVVAQLRDQPWRWRGRFVRIPLHTEPLDPGFTAELARAVLCGSLKACGVAYAPDMRWSLQAMADLADQHDLLLQAPDH